MKIASLILGFLLLFGGIIGVVVSLLLPSLTRNKINYDEAVFFMIPAILIVIVGFLITMFAGYFVARSRRRVLR